MNAVLRMGEHLVGNWRDMRLSPSWERDAATITSPWRLGTWFLILNALILGSLVLVYQLVTNLPPRHEVSQIVASMGMGRLFCGGIFLALTFFLTVFIPIRIFGIFVGPRMGRYFDQLVLSGITPWRLVAGKVVGQEVFFLIMLIASLPYFLLCLSFGGVSLEEVVLCLTVLFLYVHVLAIATLAASTLFSEWAALPVIILLFGFSAFAGLFPFSPHPLGVTPTGTIMSLFYQLFEARGIRGPAMDDFFLGGIPGLSLTPSHLIVYVAVSLLILIGGLMAVMLGPINALAPGMNTFGEVILPGDKKRASWLKRRWGLRRQGELSFLYENGSHHWRARDFWRRWELREMIFVTLLGLGMIWLYWWFPRTEEGFYVMQFFLLLGFIGWNVALFADGWTAERLVNRRWEAGQLNTFWALVNFFLLWFAFARLPVWLGLDFGMYHYYDGPLREMPLQERSFILTSLVLAMAMAFYACVRWMLLGKRGKSTAVLLSFFMMCLLAYLPTWVELLVNLGVDKDVEPYRAPWLSVAHPITMFLTTIDEPAHQLSYRDAQRGFWFSGIYYLTAAGLFTWLSSKHRRSLERRTL